MFKLAPRAPNGRLQLFSTASMTSDNTTEQVPKEIEINDSFKLTIELITKVNMDILVSPRTSIQEISQACYDSPKLKYHTCFSLSFEGKKLSPFITLGEIEGMTPESYLVMVPGKLF
jgi:Mitochondrial function, CLU-N-term